MGPKSVVKSKSTRGKQESPVTVAATPSSTPSATPSATASPRTPPALSLSLMDPAVLEAEKRREMEEANIHPSLQERWLESRVKDRPYWRDRSDRLNDAEAKAEAKAKAEAEAKEKAEAEAEAETLFDAPSGETSEDYPKSGPNYTDPYFNSDRMQLIMDQGDRLSDRRKQMYIQAEEPIAIEINNKLVDTADEYKPSKAYKQYAADDEKRMADMGDDTDYYGGRTLKKRESKTTKKPKKTKTTKKTKKAKKPKKSLKPAKRPTKKSSKRIDKCVISKTKKYRTRSSPPYPANQCPGTKKMGNDGRYYKSVADVNRVYKWARVAK
jgi:hypothetical protein